MYNEPIARITRDHISEHLGVLLDQANALLERPVTLSLPRAFDISSIVGGRTGVAGRETLPSLSIDASVKTAIGLTEDNLWEYIYSGQVLGMVAGRSADEAENIAKCYVAAVEMFIDAHRHAPFAPAFDENSLPFRISEFTWTRSSRFGAANISDQSEGARPNQMYWVDGFRMDVRWTVSESGPFQHDS